MTEEQREQLAQGLEGVDRMRRFLERSLSEAQLKDFDAQIEELGKQLKAGELEAAQKALDKVRAALPQRRRGGGGGGEQR